MERRSVQWVLGRRETSQHLHRRTDQRYQVVTKTVHEAWGASGRNEDKFFTMVQQCAELSARNRDITLPDTAAAGEKFGAWIKKQARKDPDQLLYAVVDRAVRYIGKTNTVVATSAPAPTPTPAKN